MAWRASLIGTCLAQAPPTPAPSAPAPLDTGTVTNNDLARVHYASIMVSRRNRTLLSFSAFLAVWAWSVSAAAVTGEAGPALGHLTVPQIEEQLQVRSPL